jgi:hypothetical protein
MSGTSSQYARLRNLRLGGLQSLTFEEKETLQTQIGRDACEEMCAPLLLLFVQHNALRVSDRARGLEQALQNRVFSIGHRKDREGRGAAGCTSPSSSKGLVRRSVTRFKSSTVIVCRCVRANVMKL